MYTSLITERNYSESKKPFLKKCMNLTKTHWSMKALAIKGCTEILKCLFQTSIEVFTVPVGKINPKKAKHN